ncbi:unnamed protein product [Absidia cylindrospora]
MCIKKIAILLVGCKKDLRNDPGTIEALQRNSQKPVTYEEGIDVSRKIGAYKYLECSAKSNDGVREVFEHATRAILASFLRKKRPMCIGCTIL